MLKITLFHGSDKIVEKPLYNYGKEDNDYGVGFYTTKIKERAEDWALLYGSDSAYVNEYEIDLKDLNIINLMDYGPLAWVAEVVAHRGVVSEVAKGFLPEFIKKYKIDTEQADIIIGYRADDSYSEVIESFMQGELTIAEVKKLFYKGELGMQYFIKSQEAFDKINFIQHYVPCAKDHTGNNIDEARLEVVDFLRQRRIAIAKRYIVPPISIVDAVENEYVYNKEFDYYEKR